MCEMWLSVPQNKGLQWLSLLLLLSVFCGYSQSEKLTKADSLFYFEIYNRANRLKENHLDSALYYYDQLNTFLSEKNYVRERYRVLLHIGNAYMSKGQVDRALKTYMEIAGDSSLADAAEFKMYAAISIAGIYLESEDYEKALSQYGEIREQYKAADSTYTSLLPFCVIYNNEGIANENLGHLQEAERLYRKAIQIAAKISSDYDLANAYSNMGSLKMKEGDFNRALEWHKEALLIREENNMSLGVAQSNLHLGEVYYDMDSFEKARKHLENALDISSEKGYTKLITEAAVPLKEIYRQATDFEAAFQVQEREMQAKSEILNEESLKTQGRLKAQYEYELEKKIEEENQKFRETVYRFIFAGLILLLIIAFILYALQKSKTRQTALENENIQQEKLLLHKELDYKNKKLMSNLMFLLQKNELISEIIQKLREAKKLKKTESDKMIRDIIMNLKHHHSNETWEEFDLYFQEVHSEFYNQLSSKFQLTPNELKLAAFTKLQLSSKEISSLTGQSVRTIDVGRYRLRKKLGLTNSEMNLTTFLNSI